MTILPATEDHVGAIAAMLAASMAFHAGLQPGYYRPVDPEDCTGYPREALRRERAEGALLVALEGKEALGFLNLIADVTPPLPPFIPYRHATVVDLFVAPAHRRGGVATALLGAAEAWARERGLAYLELNVLEENEAALAFYGNSGFAATSRTLRKPLK